VPEKATRQWNFVVFTNQTIDLKTGDRATEAEQIVWTMSETAPTNVKAADGFAPLDVDTYVTSAMRSLNVCMKGHGKNVIIPTEQEFASAIPQSHRKGEAAYHVKAHKGSKDGKMTLSILLCIFTKVLQVTYSSSLSGSSGPSRSLWHSSRLRTSNQSHTHLSCNALSTSSSLPCQIPQLVRSRILSSPC